MIIRRLLVSVLAIVLVATGAFAADAAGTPTANLLTGGTDQTFSRTDAAGARTFLTDALGSTVGLADAAGVITTSYTYEPYGKTTVTGSASANSQGFTGRETDATGLYFFRARYLHPTFGRFISEDSAGFAAGDPNLYAYVGGSPTNATDPSGRYLESAIDLAFIASDLWTIATGSRKEADAAWGSLLLDFGGLLIPFAFGLGHVDDALKLGHEGLGLLDDVIDPRAGKPFTRKGKSEVWADNEAQHGGSTTCSNCGVGVIRPGQSTKGVTPAPNEGAVDHVKPQSKGGPGSPPNGQILCIVCNNEKSDIWPWP